MILGPMQVAMELLDYHYADEKVRTMAVEAVEKLLNNDELGSFLLQLVQVYFITIIGKNIRVETLSWLHLPHLATSG